MDIFYCNWAFLIETTHILQKKLYIMEKNEGYFSIQILKNILPKKYPMQRIFFVDLLDRRLIYLQCIEIHLWFARVLSCLENKQFLTS